MTDPFADSRERPFRAVFAPVIWWRTYARLLYLLLAFPLGLAYFVIYVTGAALGLGLLILSIGAVILALLIMAARPIAHFERFLARGLIGESIPPIPAPRTVGPGFWRWLQGILKDSVTWKTLAFVLLRFPLGLASWILVVVLGTTAVALMGAPLAEPLGGTLNFGPWTPTTPLELWGIALGGLLAFVIVVHIVNGLAIGWGKLTRLAVTRRGVDGPPEPSLADAPPAAIMPGPSVPRLSPTPA
jgi:hypothetical protein